MNNLAKLNQKETITSLELAKQINFFREQEGRKTKTQHYDLLKVIREEFEEEINEGKISAVTYKDRKGEERPMFILTLPQAKQVLVRESKAVRRATIHYIEELENKVKNKKVVETRIVPQEFKCRMMSVAEFLEYKEAKPKIFNPQSIARQASETCKKEHIDMGKIIRGNTAINIYPLIVLNRIYYDIAEKYLRIAQMNLCGFNIDEETK